MLRCYVSLLLLVCTVNEMLMLSFFQMLIFSVSVVQKGLWGFFSLIFLKSCGSNSLTSGRENIFFLRLVHRKLRD